MGKILLCDSPDKEDELRRTVEAVTDRYCVSHERTVVKVIFSSKLLCGWLTDNFGRCAIGKTMPGWVFGMSEGYRSALLQGLIDSDGCRIKDADCAYKITTISKRLAESVRLLAEMQGYSTSVRKTCVDPQTVIEGRVVNQHDWYSVVMTKSKKRVHLKDDLHGWYKVRSVKPTGRTAAVYNMTVEEDNSYVADGIVVHNCQDLSIAGKRAGIQEGRRSNLFFEAVRIIREMREATNGEKPRYALWENVCFDGDTFVSCEDGYKRIADISIGERVRTLSGKFRPVKKVHQTKGQKVVRLYVSGGENLIVTPNHPFYARKKQYEGTCIKEVSDPEWVRACDLTKDHLS